jgi:hypothetical protein
MDLPREFSRFFSPEYHLRRYSFIVSGLQFMKILPCGHQIESRKGKSNERKVIAARYGSRGLAAGKDQDTT